MHVRCTCTADHVAHPLTQAFFSLNTENVQLYQIICFSTGIKKVIEVDILTLITVTR